MQCERCGQRPASIHLKQIKDSEVTSSHLCEECAEQEGVHTGMSKLPLAGFLASVGAESAAAAALPATTDTRHCGFCDATLQDFRDTGRLGCPHCYDTFDSHLRELLRRIHGSTQHVGEVYLTPGDVDTPSPATELAQLRNQLQRAIHAEDFEAAAELRDRVRELE
ncbi:MAG: UvrB/UvrC motif-containing protein [Gemmatimonadales bacterium]